MIYLSHSSNPLTMRALDMKRVAALCINITTVLIFIYLLIIPFHAEAQAASLSPSMIKNSGQIRYGTGLGRLLTSERERSKIDDVRFNVIEQIKVEEEGPKLLHIDGVSNRPDRPKGQRISVWINGRPYAESDLPQGLTLVRNAKDEVIGINSIVSKGKTEFAKIGEDVTRPQTPAEAEAAALAAARATQKITQQP
jgi:hypothetical protein